MPLYPVPPLPPEEQTHHRSHSGARWQILGALKGTLDGQPLDLGPLRRRMVLAELLAAHGQRLSMDALVSALWGGDSPDRAVNIVHKHVGGLRRLVEPDLPRRAQGAWLRSSAGAYETVLGADSFDLVQFRALVDRADRTQDPDAALDQLAVALQLWRGPVAGDIRAAFLDQTPFSALDRELIEVAIRTGQLAVEIGRADEVVSRLELAARISPADEHLHAQLIRCLAAAGRRDVALATFRAMRRFLLEELAIDPSRELVQAHEAVLRDRMPASKPPALLAGRRFA